MENYNRKIILTKDGSHSLFIPEINETYHSTKGALTESEYIYIQHGLEQVDVGNEPIKILEIGMGTGLNALLSFQHHLRKEIPLEYTTLEPYPIDPDQIHELNYLDSHSRDLADFFLQIHRMAFKEEHLFKPHFLFEKRKQKLEDFETGEGAYDIVYFDAFAPSKQAEIWAPDLLEKIHRYLNTNGILTTYCAQGQFKRNLKSIGFQVENPPGPLGKKEMTLARKI